MHTAGFRFMPQSPQLQSSLGVSSGRFFTSFFFPLFPLFLGVCTPARKLPHEKAPSTFLVLSPYFRIFLMSECHTCPIRDLPPPTQYFLKPDSGCIGNSWCWCSKHGTGNSCPGPEAKDTHTKNLLLFLLTSHSAA